MTNNIMLDYFALDLKIHSWVVVWPKDWSSKKLVYNQNNLTLLLEKESE